MYICLFHQFCALNLILIFFWGEVAVRAAAWHGVRRSHPRTCGTLHAHLGFPPGDSPLKMVGFQVRNLLFQGFSLHFQVRFAVSFRVIFDNMVFVDSVELQNLSTQQTGELTKIGLFGYPFKMVSSCHSKKKQHAR